MRLVRDFIERLGNALAAERSMSGFMCKGCELREYCRLPAYRRQLCNETRALRPR